MYAQSDFFNSSFPNNSDHREQKGWTKNVPFNSNGSPILKYEVRSGENKLNERFKPKLCGVMSVCAVSLKKITNAQLVSV